MNKKGVGSIVAVVILILVAVAGASIFLGVYLRNVDEDTSGDSSSCFGIDLELNSCFIFIPAMTNPSIPPNLQLTGPALLMNAERFPGGGEIKGLRFIVTDDAGNAHTEEPVDLIIPALNFEVDTNYTDLVEYNGVDAIVRDLTYNPVSVAVSAVVGKSETICAPTREPVACRLFGT